MSDHKAWTHPDLPPVQNALLIAAYLCDREKVKEVGNNRGAWVERFLKAVGLGGGYAWCAAFVSFCLKEAGYKDIPKGAAAVRNWAKWAKDNHKLTTHPKRGDLFFWLNANGTGHIGFISAVSASFIQTIEGNTDAAGSREGDGVYRKARNRSSVKFIRL